jgi:hypothetical protein
MGGFWLSVDVKEPDMLLECEVANSAWCKALRLKSFSEYFREIKLNIIHIPCVKNSFIIPKNPLTYDNYLNCFIKKHTLLRVSVRQNHHIQGIFIQTKYSFRHVEHIGLKTKYRIRETWGDRNGQATIGMVRQQ